MSRRHRFPKIPPPTCPPPRQPAPKRFPTRRGSQPARSMRPAASLRHHPDLHIPSTAPARDHDDTVVETYAEVHVDVGCAVEEAFEVSVVEWLGAQNIRAGFKTRNGGRSPVIERESPHQPTGGGGESC